MHPFFLQVFSDRWSTRNGQVFLDGGSTKHVHAYSCNIADVNVNFTDTWTIYMRASYIL
mgnify:CR=1 FL=1